MSYENYNNGNAPEPGLVWSGSSWAYPTTGYTSGNTMTVWPQQGEQKPINFSGPPGAPGYNEPTDGMWIDVPNAVSAELQRALSRIGAALNVPQWDDFLSAPFTKFTPAYEFPSSDNMVLPSIMIMPAKHLTHSSMAANAPIPSSVDLHTRIADDVVDGIQYLSAVGNKTPTPFKVLICPQD